LIGQNDSRLKKNIAKGEIESKKAEKGSEIVREVPQVSSALFFQYNTALVPPYSMLVSTKQEQPTGANLYRLVDTNFLSHTVQRKLPLLETFMDTLYAKCIPVLTSCVMAE
jgi:U3 small nucleolar RNA-associated protein 24